jgi:drug/metabolite transporter (DMT)-like permease
MIILIAILLVDEWLTPLQWLGMSMIIGSLFVIELPRKARV